MAEDDAAQRTRDEADRKGRIGQQRRDNRIAGREIKLIEDDAGDDTVKKEIIPFDRRTDQRCDDNPPQQFVLVHGLPLPVSVSTRFQSGSCDRSVREVQAATRPRSMSAKIMSDAFSAIITAGACVLPETSVGMIEQSTTRSPPIPCTRNCASVTAMASAPILQVPTGWKIVAPYSRAKPRISSSVPTDAPGRYSSMRYFRSASVAASRRAYLMASTAQMRSVSAER